MMGISSVFTGFTRSKVAMTVLGLLLLMGYTHSTAMASDLNSKLMPSLGSAPLFRLSTQYNDMVAPALEQDAKETPLEVITPDIPLASPPLPALPISEASHPLESDFKLRLLETQLNEVERTFNLQDAKTASGWQHFLKGVPAQDSIYAGMWSQHFLTHRDFVKNNNLIALQYKGFFVGTFNNSWNKQTVLVGIARTIYHKDFFNGKVQYALGYKIGPMYGYHNKGVPNIDGFSIMPLIANSLNFKYFGFDVNLVPGNAISFNFHGNRPQKKPL